MKDSENVLLICLLFFQLCLQFMSNIVHMYYILNDDCLFYFFQVTALKRAPLSQFTVNYESSRNKMDISMRVSSDIYISVIILNM